MSLNWNIGKIANLETVCYTEHADGERYLSSLTHKLIWATLAVDLGKISAKNISEWQVRLQMIAMTYEDASWAEITREQLEAHIGLETNATTSTRAGFLKKMARLVERTAVRKVGDANRATAATPALND